MNIVFKSFKKVAFVIFETPFNLKKCAAKDFPVTPPLILYNMRFT